MAQDAPQPTPQKHADRDDALAVVKRLREFGHVAYFAGGCVRDQLLGLTPKDFDVATDAPPSRVRELFTNTQAVGAAFGVILVRHGKSVVEVATFRTDLKYVDGRRPEGVVFTTAEEDAKRRDFTINGMFFDPIANKVIDYVGGQRDLKYKCLRTIGDPNERFEEDHLRLLRAVRFAARFDLEIKGETAHAIAAHREHLKRISPERVAEELRLMLTSLTRVRAWRELLRFGMLPVILRYLPETHEKPRHPRFIFEFLSPGRPVAFGLALAALALDFRAGARAEITTELFEAREARRSVQACRTALKISNNEAEMMEAVTHVAPLLSDREPSVATMKRFLATRYAAEAREMLKAVAAEGAHRSRIQWLEEQFEAISSQGVAPPPLITGDDLTAAGMTPGPVFKRVLDAVYDAQLEDRVKSKEEAMRLAMELARG